MVWEAVRVTKSLLALPVSSLSARLVMLGGAELAGQLLAAYRVDQLQPTVCPLAPGLPLSHI